MPIQHHPPEARDLAGLGAQAVSEPWAEIPAICEIHGGPGRVVLRRESDRVVLDGQIDHCCLLTLEPSAVTLMFDVLGEWLG